MKGVSGQPNPQRRMICCRIVTVTDKLEPLNQACREFEHVILAWRTALSADELRAGVVPRDARSETKSMGKARRSLALRERRGRQSARSALCKG
jgi:hypothetical protein